MGLRGPNAKPVGVTATKPRKPAWEKRGLTRAGKVVAFVESLKLTSGVHAGKRFRLRDWQKADIIEPLYATDAAGRRIKRTALVSLPRKNGKTQLAAALALCHLCGPEAEPRGQVYSAASDRKQAALIMREMVAFVLADEALSARIIIRQHEKTLTDATTGSTYEALSSDARKAHGLGPSFCVADEVAQWHGRDLYDNLATGTGARAEPLMVVISTKSGDPNSVMAELTTYAERVRDGLVDDPTFLPVIYSADADADPWDEDVWFACNPALGDFRSLEEMRTAAAQAKRLPAREPSFRLLYLNQPVSDEARFLNRRDWEACRAAIDIEALHGERCIIGMDLSSTTDLTALCAFFPDSGDLLPWFFMPKDNIEEAERRDHAPYGLWRGQGLIEATPGRAVDKAFVVHRLRELSEIFDVEAVAADRWRLDEVEKLIAEEGFAMNITPFGQGWRDMGPAIDAFEVAVLQKQLRHADHPVMNFCVANAVTQSDPTGARKLVKDKSYGRIDGLVAATMAVGFAAKTARAEASVYEARGLIAL